MHETPTWRFYQGLKDEWRWYRVDDRGEVLGSSDQAFAELDACMSNAEAAGFKRHDDFRVHARTEHEAHAPAKTG